MSATAKVRCCYVCGNPIIGACLITDKGDAHSSCVHLSDRNGEIARQAAIISHLQSELDRCREALKPFADMHDTARKVADLHGQNEFILSFGPAIFVGVLPFEAVFRAYAVVEAREPRCPKCGAQVDESFDCCKG